MLEETPKTRFFVMRVAPAITALSVVCGSLYATFSFYTNAVEAHELANKHEEQLNGLTGQLENLAQSLDSSARKINSLTDQLTILANALQYEKDSKEFILLRERKNSLTTQEIIRYCELYRELQMGSECDI